MTVPPRLLRPAPPDMHAPPQRLPPPPRLSVILAILAVVLQLTVSANLLFLMGVHYDIPGGNPLGKLHPATYCAILAVLVRVCETGDPLGSLMRLLGADRRLGLFFAMIVFCIGYSLLTVGLTGSAVYIDSYLSAGILLLGLADASATERRWLGVIMITLFLANVMIGATEALVQHHLLPFYIGLKVHKARLGNFRAVALYDHPLTGAMMTSMGLFLMLQMRLRLPLTAVLAALFLIGLFAFGGRASLVTTLAALILLGGWSLLRDLVQRRLRPGKLIGAIGTVLAGAVLVWFIVTQTHIAERIVNQFYVDQSAKAREIQWLIPGLMNIHELLFGLAVDKLPILVYQLGLVFPFEDVENFWLLAFINLGAVGFIFYLLGFLSLLADLWRRAPFYGRSMLVVTIIVASTSNSLGRKSNILFVLTGAIIAATGFAERRAAERLVAERQARQPVPVPGAEPPSAPPRAAADFTRSLRPAAPTFEG